VRTVGGLHRDDALAAQEWNGTVIEHLLTVAQVAGILRVSRSWVIDHATGRRRPYLKSIKMGKCRRFLPHDVEEFIRQCQTLGVQKTSAA
jgi:hypothetical protein